MRARPSAAAPPWRGFTATRRPGRWKVTRVANAAPGVSRGQGTAALAPSGHSRAGPSRCRLHRYTWRRMSRSQTGLRPDSGTHHTEQTQNPQLRPDSGAQRAEWSQNSAPSPTSAALSPTRAPLPTLKHPLSRPRHVRPALPGAGR